MHNINVTFYPVLPLAQNA